uniref:Uncharacterized protein n=1 Tax=Romanomermis culicivorax TaxID=13658 RepID=A0A915ICP2_ROMCU
MSSPRTRHNVVHSAPVSIRDAHLTFNGAAFRCDNSSLTVGLLAGCIVEMLIALVNAALSLAYLPKAMSVLFMCHLGAVLIVCGLAIFGLFVNQRWYLVARMFYQMVTIVGYCILLASCSCLLSIYSKNKADICQTGDFRPRVGKIQV